MKLRIPFSKILLLLPLITSFAVNVNGAKLPYKQSNLPVEERVNDLLSRMTIEEKVAQIRHLHSWNIFNGQELDVSKLKSASKNLCWGFVEGFPLTSANCKKNMRAIQKFMVENTRLGIPIFTVAESLHGVVQEGSTIFPQNIALGSTFSPELAYAKTSLIAKELHSQGVRQTLAPCIDVVRDLRWGRVEESFGEDAMLCGLMGIAEVDGYMDNGISPMLKHYGPHGNPVGGLNLASVECSDRDLGEIYLKPFEMVVKNTPLLAVMSTYNSWNNVPNSASHYLLTEILRDKWGFKGYVYSDWGAIDMLKTFHRTAADSHEAALQALTAGLDVEASSDCYLTVPELISSGEMSQDVLDLAVKRVLYAKFKMGLFENPYGEKYRSSGIHTEEAVRLSRQIADESVVLLKNENGILPLDVAKLKSIAVIGPNANQVQYGDYSWTRNNNSGVTPLQGIKNFVGQKVKVSYAKGCSLVSLNTDSIQEAVDIASRSDVAIIFCGSASAALARDYKSSTCGEGFDLNDLNLTGAQSQLIKSVHATGTPVILVLVTGKPFAISWEKDNIPAILAQWYAGEEAGNSIAGILFGAVSPSGRLPFSFPQSTGHLPVNYDYLPTDRGFYNNPGSYDAPGRDYVFSSPSQLWSFGHGLTYTSFAYSNLVADKEKYEVSDTINVSVDVKNTGKREGREVVQLYVRDKISSVVTPIRKLRAFKKVTIESGVIQRVNLKIPVSELYIVDNSQKRIVEDGEFELQIGEASDNILLKKTVVVGDYKARAAEKQELPPVSTRQIAVKGCVRDIQATLIGGVEIFEQSTGRLLGSSDAGGQYNVMVGNLDALQFRKKGYDALSVPVKNLSIINVRLNYGTE